MGLITGVVIGVFTGDLILFCRGLEWLVCTVQ